MVSKPTRVLITPAGTETAMEIYKSLSYRPDIELYGLDTIQNNPLAFLLGDNHFYTKWEFKEGNYFSELERICLEQDIDFIYPTHDWLLPMLSHGGVHGTLPIVSSSNAILTTMRKDNLWERLVWDYGRNDIAPDLLEKPPGFFRPNRGRGSIGAQLVQSEIELMALIKQHGDDYILTEYLPGKEYTVDCINDLEGNLLSHCIRQRINIKRGITHIGKTVQCPEISSIAEDLTKMIPGIKGGWFFQVKEDEAGNPKILEANLRVSGTMCLTRQAGLNIPLLTIMLFRGEKILSQSISKPATDLAVSRHLTEEYQSSKLFEAGLVIWDLDDTLLDGVLDHESAGTVFPNKNILDTIVSLYKRGTKQAICSRNKWLTRKDHLFVENLINAHCIPVHLMDAIVVDSGRDKGSMVHDIVSSLEIVPTRVLFIDDSFKERQSVEVFSKGQIKTAEPSVVIGR